MMTELLSKYTKEEIPHDKLTRNQSHLVSHLLINIFYGKTETI